VVCVSVLLCVVVPVYVVCCNSHLLVEHRERDNCDMTYNYQTALNVS
jgi:hypothetical protein